ncbi:putative molybdenum carrier protein [Spirosoma oryzae]|uniref:Putative molybdenum carrier protein n=1 Tax=Spirosoma oryzae TaxID=1469603 RepID=A0A2T0SKE1_9BACT|nr:putative molybdenum carrier protein [Spirosoma oryzae]PRY33874.1 putative molybdenum carrier protein [Spirosoma oryzae]
MYKLDQVRSGGQSGIDTIGISVAKALGFKTGGTAPKGFRTEFGPNPLLGTVFGLVESNSPDYPPRTRQNIIDSDGTLLLGDLNSQGSKLTTRLAKQLSKPLFSGSLGYIDVWEVLDWLQANNIRVLNVAGNRETKLTPAEMDGYTQFLTDLFTQCTN